MGNLSSAARVGVFLLVALVCGAFSDVVWADVHVSCTPAQNKIRVHWKFLCADPPETGQREAVSRGDPPGTPPPAVCLGVVECQSNPPTCDNRVFAHGCCDENGDALDVFVITEGCADAGGNRIEALADRPFAGVGLYFAPDIVPPDSMTRVQVERIVTPGATPDIVSVTFLGGGLQTRLVAGNEECYATLKLIVYPDAATADADTSLLAGLGSAFFGEMTLVGASGSLLAVQGFSLADFLLQDNGDGMFTARPITGLTKVALVPDANTAVVSLVGDPRVAPAGTTAVPGSRISAGLWLGPAVPNPAHGETRIPFAIPRAGRVSLGIYDQQGRRVRELVEGSLLAGKHEARWDGRDVAGRRVSSALYYYRLEVEGRKLTGKVSTIR